MGNLFHQSLDQCFEVIHENGMDWSNITEEERKELVKKCVDQVTSQYGNTIMSSSARNTYLAKRVERITDVPSGAGRAGEERGFCALRF